MEKKIYIVFPAATATDPSLKKQTCDSTITSSGVRPTDPNLKKQTCDSTITRSGVRPIHIWMFYFITIIFIIL